MKIDSGMQRSQSLFLKAAYAIVEAARSITGETKTTLIHALVLIMSGNRELNLKRRELLKPDLNSQYGALCSASTPITTELFGDDITKEIEDVSKANKLSKKLATPRRSRNSRFQPYRGGSYVSNSQRNRFTDSQFTRF